jgi:hypothetical protein
MSQILKNIKKNININITLKYLFFNNINTSSDAKFSN